jgi:hypothetical protein
MQTIQIPLRLSQNQYRALEAASQKAFRRPRDQATCFVIEKLVEAGFLSADGQNLPEPEVSHAG